MNVSEDMQDWKKETKKHIFILNSSGKPMFTSRKSSIDQEQELVNLCGMLQAIVSITRDSGDEIVCLKAGIRKIVYFIKRDLYFVSISSTDEPTSVLLRQLQFMYSQILLMMTAAVHDRNAHDVLGQETCQLLLSTCNEDVLPFSLALQAIPVISMPTTLRKELLKRLSECVNSSNAVLGLLMLDGELLCYSLASNPPFAPSNTDLLLLSHFASQSSSLQAHDQNWVPACMPDFNPRAPLQAYVCTMKLTLPEDACGRRLSFTMISKSCDLPFFDQIHEARLVFESGLEESKLIIRILESGAVNTQFPSSSGSASVPEPNTSSSSPNPNLEKTSLRDLFVPPSSMTPKSGFFNSLLQGTCCQHFLFKFVTPSLLRSFTATGSSTNTPRSPGASSSSSDSATWLPSQCVSSQPTFPFNQPVLWNKLTCEYYRLALSLRKGSSLPEHTILPSSSSDDESMNVLGRSATQDHSFAYSVWETGMIVVGIAACDSELFAVYAGPISVENACMAVGQLQLELRNSLADIFQVTM